MKCVVRNRNAYVAGMLTAGNIVEAMYADGHYYSARIVQNLSNRASGWPTPSDR